MAVQLSVELRNARLDQFESSAGFNANATVGGILTIREGAKPADCATANSGTLLVTINLPLDAMAPAGSGQKAKSGTWQDLTADAAGTAGHFRIHQATAPTICAMQGTVTATGGGGDLQLDNTVIAAGQQVTVTTFTLTDGNA